MEPSVDKNPHNNLIVGNFLGTNHGGTNAVPNGNGIRIFGAINNTIGGDTPSERNIISEIQASGLNKSFGILPGIRKCHYGNYIGLSKQGSARIANGAEGIRINSAENRIGGSAAGEGNVISGNEIGII